MSPASRGYWNMAMLAGGRSLIQLHTTGLEVGGVAWLAFSYTYIHTYTGPRVSNLLCVVVLDLSADRVAAVWPPSCRSVLTLAPPKRAQFIVHSKRGGEGTHVTAHLWHDMPISRGWRPVVVEDGDRTCLVSVWRRMCDYGGGGGVRMCHRVDVRVCGVRMCGGGGVRMCHGVDVRVCGVRMCGGGGVRMCDGGGVRMCDGGGVRMCGGGDVRMCGGGGVRKHCYIGVKVCGAGGVRMRCGVRVRLCDVRVCRGVRVRVCGGGCVRVCRGVRVRVCGVRMCRGVYVRVCGSVGVRGGLRETNASKVVRAWPRGLEMV